MSSPHPDAVRLRLIQQILALPAAQLAEAESFFARLQTNAAPEQGPVAAPSVSAARLCARSDWPHAPPHRLSEQGTYIVTSGTSNKAHYFRGPERLDYLEGKLLALAKVFGWQLEAWAVFSNHYHFVAHSPADAQTLSAFTRELHHQTACHVNELDGAAGRQVWFNYWETRLTFEKSYFARLSYVHRNAVKHGLVAVAAQYPWCSAAWLERTAPRSQVETLYRFKIDKVRVEDDFDPV
jgi:putative transposase